MKKLHVHYKVAAALFVKASVLDDYKNGKSVELRISSLDLEKLKVGDVIALKSSIMCILRRITAIRLHANFEAACLVEKYSDIFPGVTTEKEFRARVVEFYPDPERFIDKKVIAFTLTRL